MNVTIAGASGFIGKNFINNSKSLYNLKGIGRSRVRSSDDVTWVHADLFSYHSIENALINTDIAIYLVHSMLPSSKLFQGNFQDTDLLLADNFAKACIKNGVKQIIYLGGLAPQGPSSEHLKSRLEVEEVFKSSGIPTTTLRAGMIVGNGGSSFEILKNLVINLPMMILPLWTKSRTQLVFIDDLIRVINKAINNKDFYDRTINVVNGEDVTYEQLIKKTAKKFNQKCPMIAVPVNYLKLSKWWVSLFGEAPFQLVSPLIDSLKCSLPKVSIDSDIKDCISIHSYDSMLERISSSKIKKSERKKRVVEHKSVRSIQRLENPSHLDMNILARLYMKWLPRFIHSLVYSEQSKDVIKFKVRGIKKSLLALRYVSDNSNLSRAKFYIVGGLLSATNNTGWLEFRSVVNGKYTLVSINNYKPSLPWYLYRYTQALIHLWVMKSFNNYLKHLKQS